MKPITFSIIGGGWRAEFYVRIATQLPHLFRISGVYIRNPKKAEHFKSKWNIPIYHSLDEVITNKHHQFIVLAISKANVTNTLLQLSSINVPILAETPPATTVEQLTSLYSKIDQFKHVQVAEQYLYQPMNKARLNVIESDLLGSINHVQASLAHGYHGVHLIRKWLGVQSEPCTIIGTRSVAPVVEGPNRYEVPTEEKLIYPHHDVAFFQFEGGKTAVYDFCREQYFSPIRGNRVLIRGTKGEISNELVSWTSSPGQYSSGMLNQKISGLGGQLAPLSLQGIQFEGRWLYENPFYPTSLSDEEIAIAHVLLKMSEFVAHGQSFYSLKDALVDTYFSLMLEQACLSNQRFRADFNRDMPS